MSDRIIYQFNDGNGYQQVSESDLMTWAGAWRAFCLCLGEKADADPNALARELREWRAGMLEDVRELEF